VEALHTIVRVLPDDLYDKVVSGKGHIMPGASVPGGGSGEMQGMHGGHMHGGMPGMPGMEGGQQHGGHEPGSHEHGEKPGPKKGGQAGADHEHHH
jgi:hypothetical protein